MHDHPQQLHHTKLTCVHYAPGDTLGKLLAHVALAPVLLLVWQASRVAGRREVHEAVVLAGLVLEEGVARGLKHLLQHPRPATCALLHMCHSHGMPSSHTSMMWCAAAAASCAAARHLRRQGRLAALLTSAELAALWVAALGVGVSRVYLGYHSTDQVAAGALLGLLFGCAWSLVMHLLQPLYAALAAVPLLQRLGVKDTYGCPEPLLVEADAHRAQQGGSSKKRS
jgi:dolichyldiphosphatase